MSARHPSRFDPAKRYSSVRFTNERFLHSYDVNDGQDILAHRLRSVSDVFLKDGGVVSGGSLLVDRVTGLVQMEAGRVYAAGIVHDVPERAFTVPVDRTVRVGLCVTETIVDYTTDPDLRGLEPGTRAYGEPGADRLQVVARWTWDGEGTCAGKFYGVYTVDRGELLTVAPPLDPVDDRLARYDRESNGHYIVSGWRVTPLGYSAADQSQRFSISEGVINVWGYKRERTTSLRLVIPEAPDVERVASEPHTLPAGQTGGVIYTNHSPVSRHIGVTVLRQATATLTHGAYLGIADPLPHTSVAAIIEVKQGATVYQQGSDYVLAADHVDWRQVGTDEPSPGSTYQVTYQWLDRAVPTVANATSVTISSAVAGSIVVLEYEWALPRIDVIAVDRDGAAHYITGQSSRYTPIAPPTPLDMLAIARVTNRWGQTPTVQNVGTRAVHNTILELHGALLGDLYDLVAQERLRRDMDSRQPTAKRGVFVDPFLDDDMRDQGLAQTGAIVSGELRLPIATTVDIRTLQREPASLAWTEELAIDQPLRTSSMRVNPYMAFAPLPARVHLDPAVDRWVVFDSAWTSPETRQVVHTQGRGLLASASVVDEDVTIESLRTTSAATTIRPIDVLFDIEGFGVGEPLASVVFDGVPVTPRTDPAVGTPLVGNAEGRLRGVFTIPGGVPVGAKRVDFTGVGGTVGIGTYVGSGEITIQTMRMVTTQTVVVTRWDPLAQTFTLPQPRHIAAVDVWFAAIGNRANHCVVQVREVNLGLPSQNVVASKVVDMHDVRTDGWTHVAFDTPVPTIRDAEYAIVVLTDDAAHALATAALGDFDTAAQRFVTAQPYQIGVLLSSSNASTWTPHNEADLAFRVYTARFTETTKTVPLSQAVALDACTDLIIYVGVEEPTIATRALVKITRESGEVVYARPGQAIVFDTPVTEEVTLAVVVSGNGTDSPIVYPWIGIVQGTISATGTYISRAMPAGSPTDLMNVVVTFESLQPTGSGVVVETGRDGAWTAMEQHAATPVGDGWVERTLTLSDYTLSDARIRLTLTGNSAARPRVRQLRANVTGDPINIITGQ